MLFPGNYVFPASMSCTLKSEDTLTHCFNDWKEEPTSDVEEPNDNMGDTIEDSCEVYAKDEDLEMSDSKSDSPYEDVKVKQKRNRWKNGAKVGYPKNTGTF